jgi:hypothetical protein
MELRKPRHISHTLGNIEGWHVKYRKDVYVMKKRFYGMVMSTFLLSSLIPVYASAEPVFHAATKITDDKSGVSLEIPADLYNQQLNINVLEGDKSKTPGNNSILVAKTFQVDMTNNNYQTIGVTNKPFRIIASFDKTLYELLSRNLNTSVGHLRIGYWDNTNNEWRDYPSKVYWNGANGEVVTNVNSPGIYGLLWSNNNKISEISNQNVQLQVNYEPVNTDVSSFIKAGTTMVPLRVIAESLHANVYWDNIEQRIDIVKGVTTIKIWVGKSKAFINGKEVNLTTAPIIVNSRTFVPIRFIAENFAAKVDWDQISQTVYINQN